MISERKQTTRRFLGKTENFENKLERNFYDKMLKAYLKGQDSFRFGFKTDITPYGTTGRVPAYYEVQFQK